MPQVCSLNTTKRTSRLLSTFCTACTVVLFAVSCGRQPVAPDGAPTGFIPKGGGLGLAAVQGDCLNELVGVAGTRFNNATCTANDVEIKRLEVTGGPITCVEGDPLPPLDLRAFFGLNSTERFDIAYFFATDGDLDARTGDCVHGFLEPIEDGGAPDPLGGSGPFRELEGDANDICGDAREADEPESGVNEGIAAILDVPQQVTGLTCTDPDGDGFLDIGTCTSWDNNEQETCEGINDAFPGTPAKCNCEPARVEIQVVREATVRVVKDLIPSSDAGRFDLKIFNASDTQVALANDVGDGGSAQATIQWAVADEPDSNKASVQEFAGTPNPGLANYDISYTCVETGGATIGPTAGTGPQELVLASGDEWVCTFTNTRHATLTVNKVCDPTTDTGRFDLRIDGVVEEEDAACGGTTSAVEVSIGNHTVSEVAGTGTNLADYTTEIGGDCAANGSVTVAAGDNKVCTITNTRFQGEPGNSIIVRFLDFTVSNTDGDSPLEGLSGQISVQNVSENIVTVTAITITAEFKPSGGGGGFSPVTVSGCTFSPDPPFNIPVGATQAITFSSCTLTPQISQDGTLRVIADVDVFGAPGKQFIDRRSENVDVP